MDYKFRELFLFIERLWVGRYKPAPWRQNAVLQTVARDSCDPETSQMADFVAEVCCRLLWRVIPSL
jgi:hypothetical protein